MSHSCEVAEFRCKPHQTPKLLFSASTPSCLMSAPKSFFPPTRPTGIRAPTTIVKPPSQGVGQAEPGRSVFLVVNPVSISKGKGGASMSMKTQKAQQSRCCLYCGTEKGNRWPRGIVSSLSQRYSAATQSSPSLTHRAGKPTVYVTLTLVLCRHPLPIRQECSTCSFHSCSK